MKHHRSANLRTIPWPINLIGSLVAVHLLGCECAPGPIHFKNVRPPSQAGARSFARAKTDWVRLQAADPQEAKVRERMEAEVIAALEGAIINDADCPVFYGKLGEVYLERESAAGATRALVNLTSAVSFCEDWVPAWIAMARVAVARGQLEEARTYLQSASEALRRLGENYECARIAPFDYTGLSPSSHPEEAPAGPEPTRDARLRLLLQWLVENEAWRIDNQALLQEPQASSSVDGGKITRRLQARIDYCQYLVLRAGVAVRPNSEESEPAGWRFMGQLDHALKWDPDLLEARVEKARLFHARGLYQEAKDLLYQYVVPPAYPLIHNNVSLVFLLATVYADWYLESPGARDVVNHPRFDMANELCDRITKRHPDYAACYEMQADLALAFGIRSGKRDYFVAAGAFLDKARSLRGKETTENRRRRSELEKALAALDGKETP